MSQVSQAHKLQWGGVWLWRDRPRPGLFNDRSRPRPLSLLPKKSMTRHTWLQWDVRSQAFYSGDCGLRIELPNAGQMDSQGSCTSTLQVTIWGLFKAQGQQAPLNGRPRRGNKQGVFLIESYNLKIHCNTESPIWVSGSVLTSSDTSLVPVNHWARNVKFILQMEDGEAWRDRCVPG